MICEVLFRIRKIMNRKSKKQGRERWGWNQLSFNQLNYMLWCETRIFVYFLNFSKCKKEIGNRNNSSVHWRWISRLDMLGQERWAVRSCCVNWLGNRRLQKCHHSLTHLLTICLWKTKWSSDHFIQSKKNLLFARVAFLLWNPAAAHSNSNVFFLKSLVYYWLLMLAYCHLWIIT